MNCARLFPYDCTFVLEDRNVQHVRFSRATIVAAGLSMAALVGATVVSGQEKLDEVSISAVVLDRNGLPVRNLHATDFSVLEDGKPVELSGFEATTAADASAEGRSIVLLLGGQGSDPEITLRYKQVADLFFKRETDRDRVAVVRMSGSDEIVGSPADMRMRVAEFRAPFGEPLNAKTRYSILDRLASIAGQFSDDDQRRKAIVCIGSSFLFDTPEPRRRQYDLIWPHWVKALNALARVNGSVYVIDPKGLDGRTTLVPDGLVAQTGGATVDNSNDFSRAVQRVWTETGNYYLLTYAASESNRELHSIQVKASHPEWRVRARRTR